MEARTVPSARRPNYRGRNRGRTTTTARGARGRHLRPTFGTSGSRASGCRWSFAWSGAGWPGATARARTRCPSRHRGSDRALPAAIPRAGCRRMTARRLRESRAVVTSETGPALLLTTTRGLRPGWRRWGGKGAVRPVLLAAPCGSETRVAVVVVGRREGEAPRAAAAAQHGREADSSRGCR